MGEVTAMGEPSKHEAQLVAAARERGVVFVLDPEHELFTLEWHGPRDELIEDDIKADYEKVLAWLIGEEAKDIATVHSILPRLGDAGEIDWSQPLADWTKDQMTDFLLIAWRLLGETGHGRISKPAVFDETVGDPIPF
jgi:hypothetical protein